VPARAASCQPGNGDDHDLAALVIRFNKLRQELWDLAPRIGLLTDPSDKDLQRAYRCASQILLLIVEQVIPARPALARRSSPEAVHDLNRALEAFQTAAHQALITIDTYIKTLQNERRQSERKRRSNKQYSADQLHLHQLRLRTNTELQALAEHSDGFLRALSV